MSKRVPCHKPDAREIVIVGCGLSLDLAHQGEYTPNSGRIVISVNASIPLVKCDYAVSVDKNSIAAWHRYVCAPDQYYVMGANLREWARRYPMIPLFINDHLPYQYAGSGSVAFALAYSLYRDLPSIQRITYIGIDSCEGVSETGERYFYASCLRPHLIGKQPGVTRPAGVSLQLEFSGTIRNKRDGMTTSETIRYTHGRQMRAYHRLFVQTPPSFKRALDCRSYCNIVTLSTAKIPSHATFERARHDPGDRSG